MPEPTPVEAVMLADLVSRLRPALGQMNQVLANPDLYTAEQVAEVKREGVAASLLAAGRLLRYDDSPLYPLMTATTDDERERLSQAALAQPQEAPPVKNTTRIFQVVTRGQQGLEANRFMNAILKGLREDGIDRPVKTQVVLTLLRLMVEQGVTVDGRQFGPYPVEDVDDEG